MNHLLLAALLPIMAFLVSLAVYPLVLRFAKNHGIVDNPNARKLQRVPVPVMGGIAVFIGIAVSLIVGNIFFTNLPLWVGFIAMTVMMLIGVWDDMKDVPPVLRFLIELFVVWAMMFATKTGIDDFHGFWGREEIDTLLSMPLTIVAGVGIINAINLVDGVDGYSSGYGMTACILFSILFFSVGDYEVGCLALIVAGALLPFFLHNVFGYKSKMFIGDSGTLMLGTALATFVFSTLSKDSSCGCLEEKGFGLIAFTLAVLAIPVFDTLRVMSVRIIRGSSPFQPDKTHLHHLFIEMGYSHIGAAISIITMNLCIVAIWFLSWKLGASIDVQTYIVVALGIISTFVFYKFMRTQQNGGELDEEGYPTGTRIWKTMCKRGEKTHIERTGFWKTMRKIMDEKPLGGGY